MQRAEDPSRLSPTPEPRAGLRPTSAFLLLLLVLIAVGAFIYLTRPTQAPTPAGTEAVRQPNFSLTNEEAIARFEELNAMRLEMYEERDLSLSGEFLAAGSPLLRTARDEIQQLISDKVTVEMHFEVDAVRVLSNNASRIVIRTETLEAPVFHDMDGRDISKTPAMRKVVDWTLVNEDSTWRVLSLKVVRTEKA